MSESTPPGNHPQPWDHHEPWEAHAAVAPDVAMPPPPPLVPHADGRDAFGKYDPTNIQMRSTAVVYAGFWRRFWARTVTGLIVLWITSAALAGLKVGTEFLFENTQTCLRTTTGLQVCEGVEAVHVGGAVLGLLINLGIAYYFFSRSMAVKAGTIGMKQMGLTIRNGRDFTDISKQKAFNRTLVWALPVVALNALTLGELFGAPRAAIGIGVIVAAVLVVIAIVGALAMLGSERRQTAWDRAADTVVVVQREPSWLSLLALIIGMVVPYAAWIGLYLSGAPGESVTTRVNHIWDGDFAITSLLRWFIPLIVVSVGAIVFGHLGLHETKWNARRPAGRGLAVTGATLGYSVPVLLVLGLAITFTTDRVDSLNERTCKAVRRYITRAAEAYHTLNNEYPEKLTELSDTAYLGEAPDEREWTYLPLPSSVGGYRLKGINKCAKA